MSALHTPSPTDGRRIVICDYTVLLHSVTRLLRLSGYVVVQAHDGRAAAELCLSLPGIGLLVLNTYGTGVDVGGLIGIVRAYCPGFPVLHIGNHRPEDVPGDVPTLAQDFTAGDLQRTVESLMAVPAS